MSIGHLLDARQDHVRALADLRRSSAQRALEALRVAIDRLAPPIARAELAVCSSEGGCHLARSRILFARAARFFGRVPVVLLPEEQACVPFQLHEWTTDLLARVILLANLSRWFGEPAFDGILERAYHHGEWRERVAVLHTLWFVPHAERHVELAAHACRSHVAPVFSAICCDNPYPCSYFDSPTFRQMALKALSTDVAIDRILGLERDEELTRMARALVSERVAAGRNVSVDALRLAGAFAVGQGDPL